MNSREPRPRFSVVIPTRNRPALLRVAVETVMRQTYGDWELVLSDNSTNEETRAMMAEFDDPRVRYLRPDDLSMCDNWEFACRHAEGEYVCVVEDKQALKYHALERLAAVIDQERPEMLRWQWDSLEPYGLGFRIRRQGPRGGVRRLAADDVLALLVDGNYMDGKFGLPIAHYCAFHRDLLERVRAGAIGRLFPPVSPDYTLAIQALNFGEELVYIDEGLVTFSDVTVSNGVSVMLKTQPAKDFARSIGGAQVFYDHVPVKCVTVSGSIYNDFVKLREQLGGRLAGHPPNWPNYFLECYDAIRGSVELGVDMSAELAECERALEEQAAEVQTAVRQGLQRTTQKKSSLSRRVRKSPPVLGFTRTLKSVVNGRILGREDWRFDHILDYLDHESQKYAGAAR